MELSTLTDMTRAMEVPTGHALREQVAEEVRALMARRRISGVELGRRLGKSQAFISRRLVGTTPFDVDDLEALAQIFGVPVTSLFGLNVAGGMTGSTNKSKWITSASVAGCLSLTGIPRTRNVIHVRGHSTPRVALRPHVARRCPLAPSALFHTAGHSS